MLRINSGSNFAESSENVEDDYEKTFSALAAQERAQRVASLVGSHSAPSSARTSLEEGDSFPASRASRAGPYPVRIDDIPLVDMESKRPYDEDSDDDLETGLARPKASSSSEAHKLVRAHTRKQAARELKVVPPSPGLVSGQVTPTEEQAYDEYVPRPQQYVVILHSPI